VLPVTRAFTLIDLKHWCREAVDHERDNAGGVGLKRKPRHVEHQLSSWEEFGLIRDVLRRRRLRLRLWSLLPLPGDREPLLQLTHGVQILIQTRAIRTPEPPLNTLYVVRQNVQHAATFLKTLPTQREFVD